VKQVFVIKKYFYNLKNSLITTFSNFEYF